MALEAIIIRADGALAETEDVRRLAFAQVFAEAGFAWSCSRDAFAQSQRFGHPRSRMARFVDQALKGKPQTPDISPLIDAMHRRACKLFSELLQSHAVEPRVGIRELVTACKQEGLQLVVSTLLQPSDAELLLRKTLGTWATSAIATISFVAASDGDTDAVNHSLYDRVRRQLDRDPCQCLVIEATASGARAAWAAGFPVVTTRSAFCAEGGVGAPGPLFEDLPSLVAVSDDFRVDGATADDRAHLIATIQRLHAANFAALSSSDGSDAMRVSEILKIKGTEVKTIDPAATIATFAERLKVDQVGAMVVLDAAGAVRGIISERDVARGLTEFGADLPRIRVADLMTRSVVTCQPDDSLAAVAKVMTVRRIRHLPVVVDNGLVGVISIGDVLKHRLDEVQLEANVLREFALARK